MKAELKPGTRCECQADHDGHHVGPLFRECKDGRGRRRDAVRLVTIPFSTHPSTGTVDVPMCQACADHAEHDLVGNCSICGGPVFEPDEAKDGDYTHVAHAACAEHHERSAK